MSSVSLGMTNYPQMGVVGATWPILIFWGGPHRIFGMGETRHF